MNRRYYFYLIYLIVVTLAATTASFSKYRIIVAGTGQATVARPVVTYQPISLELNGQSVSGSGEGIDLSNIKPGDQFVYVFEVRNYEEISSNEVVMNQVLMKYRIEVEFTPEELVLPLDWDLEPDDSYPPAGDGWTKLGFGHKIEHRYSLTVSWPEEEDSTDYSAQQQTIEIIINSQQTQ